MHKYVGVKRRRDATSRGYILPDLECPARGGVPPKLHMEAFDSKMFDSQSYVVPQSHA